MKTTRIPQLISSLGNRSFKTLLPKTRPKCIAVMAGLVGIALALPTPAHADILGVFDSIFSTIQSDMGASLKAINQMTQEIQQLYQETVWPLAMVNQARGFVSNSITSYRSYMTQVFQLSSPSATLANPQQLETILHSRTSTQIPALQTSFTTNYGSVPAVNVASPQDRVMIDIDDALGQENLKTTLIADQGQDLVLATANQMENQVAVSAPGSTPFLTAQAQVANLRCQAFMQKMLAAELRQEAGRIAHDNVLIKRRATSAGNLNQFVSGSLTHQ
ncbi:MAG: hypothetical protein KGK08_01650 [Acidobacteriota bacterium]|nr:hypothetical protein [Acidobacteriota bacterium]